MDLPGIGSALAVGATTGVLSTLHCAAMCGPLAALAGSERRHGGWAWLGGRALGYSGAGALTGALGGTLADLASARIAGAIVSALAATALFAAGMRLVRPRPEGLVSIRRKPSRWLERLLERLLGLVRSRPLLVGAMTSLLPCGALYAALAASALAGSAPTGAATMLAFAATSSAGLGLAGALAFPRGGLDRRTERLLGAALVLGALVLALRPAVQSFLPHGSSCHDHESSAWP